MLANFIAEVTSFPKEVQVAPEGKLWQVYVDGSSCWASWGVGVHIVTEHEEEHNYAVKLTYKTTNNETEYKALLVGMLVAGYWGLGK